MLAYTPRVDRHLAAAAQLSSLRSGSQSALFAESGRYGLRCDDMLDGLGRADGRSRVLELHASRQHTPGHPGRAQGVGHKRHLPADQYGYHGLRATLPRAQRLAVQTMTGLEYERMKG